MEPRGAGPRNVSGFGRLSLKRLLGVRVSDPHASQRTQSPGYVGRTVSFVARTAASGAQLDGVSPDERAAAKSLEGPRCRILDVHSVSALAACHEAGQSEGPLRYAPVFDRRTRFCAKRA